jgi:hypothetical protein
MDPFLQSSLGVVTLVNQASQESLLQTLETWGERVFVLDGSNVHDGETFLAQAAHDLPLTQRAHYHWAGFPDDLWGWLLKVEDQDVSLVWSHADRMLDGGLADLLLAVECVSGVARQVYDPTESGFPREMSLRLFLLGEGANFPEFPPPAA